MIGWFVDVYVKEGQYSLSIDDYRITDARRPYTVLEVPRKNSFVTENEDEFISYAEESLGSEFFNTYGIPEDLKDNPYGYSLYDIATGYKAFAPNLYAEVLNNDLKRPVNKTILVVFNSINRAFSISYSSRGSRKDGKVYDVSGNKLIFRMNGIVDAIFSYVYGYVFSFETKYNNEPISENTQIYRIGLLARGYSQNNNQMKVEFNPIEAPDSPIHNLLQGTSNPDFTVISPDNPYEPGGPSGPGGGDGTFDNDSDQITDSSLPTISSANTGFTRIYNPSLSQVQDLARYLWTDSSVIETIWNHIKQFFENPMEAIIGFNLVPVPVPNGGTQNFALMYIDTGVEMTVAASQFVDVDCGTLELKEYYGSALDYSPNTKVSCFLPFIGTVSLNTDEVMGRTLQVKYRVDICSGSCVAKISVDGNFIYQYSGHCAINIPISAADFSSYVSSAISVAKLAGGALAAGAAGVVGAGAVEAVQQTNQVVTTTQITNTARNPATGRQITTGTTTRVETRESPTDQSSTQASFSGLTPQNIANTVGQIMTSKPSIEHSGSFSGNSGYLGVRRPFLIIERPNMCMPANFQALNGFPSMITLELSTCKGFTRVQQVQLTGLSATNPEQAEILQLLKSGVVM